MSFNLYAHVAVPVYVAAKDGSPLWVYDKLRYRRVLVGNYGTKLLAQWWGINIKRPYIDAEQTMLATERTVMMYEIEEVP